MKFIAVLFCVFFLASAAIAEEIGAYHFHTYYFQYNENDKLNARNFRQTIIDQVEDGVFAECAVNRFNERPVGPHPVGSFETCCNRTSVSSAMSWFMMNHGNFSILLHPLTRFSRADHTDRAMWLGEKFPVIVQNLSVEESRDPRCPDYNNLNP
ncbi:Dopa 4,5-dioxygenase [Halotydeus destructor]|nr:Dopa 4,5-dioxygenase [Halotydeus destructor]